MLSKLKIFINYHSFVLWLISSIFHHVRAEATIVIIAVFYEPTASCALSFPNYT